MLKIGNFQFYKVKRGDTIKGLSEQLPTTMYALIEKNCLTKEPIEGDILRLPPPAKLYTVQAGDTKVLLCGSEEAYHTRNGTTVFYLGMRVCL